MENEMECQESQNLMPADIDHELDSPSIVQVAAHLADCPVCANACEHLVSFRRAINTLGTRYSAPSHLAQRIKNLLFKEKQRAGRPTQMPSAWIHFGIATAASMAFAFTLILYWAVRSKTERIDQEVVASHFRSHLPNHLADVASSDRHTVKPWFTGKLDLSPPVHDLAEEGIALIGGRLDYSNERPVAAMAYRHRQHVLNVYAWPDNAHSIGPMQVTSKQGYQLIHWTQYGMNYWVISDMNAHELMGFARLLKSQIDQDRLL
jgi:anti-sigma factor RsiW